jgi:Dna[CI] antecedent, DciA
MPNKPPRNKQAAPRTRATLSAASLLQRITRKSAISLPQMGSTGTAGLLKRVQESVPAELRLHIFEVILRPGELVVFTESAAWAGRLRLALAEARADPSRPSLPELADHPKLTLRVQPRGGFRR